MRSYFYKKLKVLQLVTIAFLSNTILKHVIWPVYASSSIAFVSVYEPDRR